MGRGFGFVGNQGRRSVTNTEHLIWLVASRVLDEDQIKSLRRATEQAFGLESGQLAGIRVLEAGVPGAPNKAGPSTSVLYGGWQAPVGPWPRETQEKWYNSSAELKEWMADQVTEGRPVRSLVLVAVAGAVHARTESEPPIAREGSGKTMQPGGIRGQEKALSLIERREDGIHIVDVTPAIRHSLGYLSEAFILVSGRTGEAEARG